MQSLLPEGSTPGPRHTSVPPQQARAEQPGHDTSPQHHVGKALTSRISMVPRMYMAPAKVVPR